MGSRDQDLEGRLQRAGGEELAAFVERQGAKLDVPAARQVLRNPFVTVEIIEFLLSIPELVRSYEIRRELAGHPLTPRIHALRLIPTLYWRDLLRLGVEMRVPPAVRLAADRELAQRLPGLAVGEKITIARSSGPGILTYLRNDPSPRVIGALLENPRLTEGILAPLVRSDQAQPQILQVIAEDRRWGLRYDIRVGLSRNPRTLVETTLRILPTLKKNDLRAVAHNRRLSPIVRRRARLLLGDLS